MKTKIFKQITKILFIMVLTTAMASTAFAINIDGRFDPTEGYTSGFNVHLVDAAGNRDTDSRMWYYQDAGTNDLYVAFIMSTGINDNSYGVNSIGWDHRKDGHKFKELLGSDKAEFEIKNLSGDILLDMKIDYVHGYGTDSSGGKKGKKGKDSPPYRSGGVIDGDGKMEIGDAQYVLDVETSMGYNYAQFGVSHPGLFGEDSDSPAADENYNLDDPATFSKWIFNLVYEFQIDGDLFNDFGGFGSVWITDMHNSPAKMKGTPQVPEPATMLLLGSGLISLVGLRKRIKG